jgi:hypothetical protein
LDGNAIDPASLHKYLYASGDPVNAKDPTGKGSMVEYEFNIGDRVFKIALHPAHHYFTFAGKAFWCLHIMLAAWIPGDGSTFWSTQIPLIPLCSAAGPW